jgi:hypothetical protein
MQSIHVLTGVLLNVNQPNAECWPRIIPGLYFQYNDSRKSNNVATANLDMREKDLIAASCR